jgi:hypothetical protein
MESRICGFRDTIFDYFRYFGAHGLYATSVSVSQRVVLSIAGAVTGGGSLYICLCIYTRYGSLCTKQQLSSLRFRLFCVCELVAHSRSFSPLPYLSYLSPPGRLGCVLSRLSSTRLISSPFRTPMSRVLPKPSPHWAI